jgi:hypothetical protein
MKKNYPVETNGLKFSFFLKVIITKDLNLLDITAWHVLSNTPVIMGTGCKCHK